MGCKLQGGKANLPYFLFRIKCGVVSGMHDSCGTQIKHCNHNGNPDGFTSVVKLTTVDKLSNDIASRETGVP